MEKGSDTSQTGWREEMVEKRSVKVSVRICGVHRDWVKEAEGDAGFKCFYSQVYKLQLFTAHMLFFALYIYYFVLLL